MTREQADFQAQQVKERLGALAEERKADAERAQRERAFYCCNTLNPPPEGGGELVTPAQCLECWEGKTFSERSKYHDNRLHCIKENSMRKEAPPPGSKPTPSTREGESKEKLPAIPSAAPQPEPDPTLVHHHAKVETGALARVGNEVEIELEKGQAPVKVKITKEMAADRKAALTYASDAAQSKMTAEIQLCVAAALYLGADAAKPEHAPWAIDGFYCVTEAGTTMFGWSQPKVSYRQRLGRAFIAQYGKENVLQRATELGVSKVPHRKLREFLKVPHQFEQFLNTGRFALPDGKEITVDDICKRDIGQLNLLFEKFAEPRSLPDTRGALNPNALFPGAEEEDEYEKRHKQLLRASDAETKLITEFGAWGVRFKMFAEEIIDAVKLWPANAFETMCASTLLQEYIKGAELEAGRLFRIFCAIQREPGRIQEIADSDYVQDLAAFRLILKEAEDNAGEKNADNPD